ncbi:MAG: endonuclease/exonuclease/phosphatase family protein [Propionibacteriaceae bacterium]
MSAGVSWDTYAPARPFQGFWIGLGVLFLLPGLVGTALYLFPPADDTPALVAAFIPYSVLAYGLALICFLVALLRARRRFAHAVLTVIAATLLTCHVLWLAPLFIPDNRPVGTGSFTLMSLNMFEGAADPQDVAHFAQQADVVVLLEATVASVSQLQPYGWGQRFPYSVGNVQGEVGDTVLYSRFPLSQDAELPRAQFQQWITTVHVPELGKVRVIAAHPCNPFCGSNLFSSEHAQLRATADANLNQPLVIAGDLNAVDDHAPIRALKGDGLRSVTDILGAGWLPTYPANRTIPPLLPIDHVLVNRFLTATAVTRIHVAGTDHLGLMVTIAKAG